MSTSGEVREQGEPPEPAQFIFEFRAAHEDLIETAQATYFHPSDFTIDLLSDRVQAANAGVKPFFDYNFFRSTDQELAVTEALGSVRAGMIELADKITDLRGEGCAAVDFPDEALEEYVQKLLFSEDEVAAQLSGQFCEAYSSMVDVFESAIVASAPVDKFLKRQARKEDLVRNVKHYGALFAVVVAANVVSDRFKRK